MADLLSEPVLKQFFNDIYQIIKKSAINIFDIWCEINEIGYLNNLNKSELQDFLNHFEFVHIEKGNYTYYLSINKILFFLDCFKYIKLDLKDLAEFLNYNGFEALIQQILIENDYKTIKNFRFLDKSDLKYKTKQKRYEIDVVGISNKYLFLIDGKHWKRKDSFASLNKAADLQYQRAFALTQNPDILADMLLKVSGKPLYLKKNNPLLTLPIMVTLEDNSFRLSTNQIPLVSISKFNGFLQEIQKFSEYYNILKIKKLVIQTQII